MLVLKRFVYVFIVLSLVCGSVPAQQNTSGARSDWGNLRKLESEARIFVTTKTGAEYEGEFRGTTDDAILLTDVEGSPTAVFEVKRGDVREVRKVRSRFTRNVIGGAVAAGVAIGTIAASVAVARTSDSESALIVPAIAIPGGIAAGGFIGNRLAKSRSLRKGARVYIAP